MDSIKIYGEARRSNPGLYGEAYQAPVRVSRYGEQIVHAYNGSKLWGAADEGRYFFAGNPTPATAIAGHPAATTLDDLKPTLAIRNGATTAEAKRIYLDFIEIMVGPTAGTNNTDLRWAMKLDNTERTLAAGSLIVPVNTNMDDTTVSVAGGTAGVGATRFGAVTAVAASSSARLVGHGMLRSIKVVTLDLFRFVFGGAETPLAPFGIDLATKTFHQVPVAPVVIGPGQTFLLHLFATGQTVASDFEFKLGYVER